ncbi:hypothetical protein OAB57_01820 [Bacteriovoracaceae bacterium]|nr:hypothetical protein [Bacteriovoracaceae bacterium]
MSKNLKTYRYQKFNNSTDIYQFTKKTFANNDFIQNLNLPVSIGIEEYPSENKIIAKGKGFSLWFKFSDSTCNYELELSFLLRPLRKNIERIIQDYLDQNC